MKVIEGENAILGRLSAHVAKTLLLGEEVAVVNAEKAIVTGSKEMIFANYKEKHDRGHRYKGPFFPKEPHMIVKRTIRGMIPWKRPRGQAAFKRLKVYIGTPEEFKGKAELVPETSFGKSSAPKFVRVERIAKFLGWVPKL